MQRLTVCLTLICLSALVIAQDDSLDAIREMRLEGRLSDALTAATARLGSADEQSALKLHLELAKIHDRVGLHNNTRPVAVALEHIEIADALAQQLDSGARAHVELAYAEYFYRAEMSERVFATAARHANAALKACRALEEIHCQADAVHRLGLIHLQKRELDTALELFEESLRIDRLAGERPLLRADYERHAGFVFALREDYAIALPYFERSLEHRIDAGAIDASMFAAISLASTLNYLGRDDEAQPHLDYALKIANNIDSDTGRARVQTITTRMAE
ncbi:MAG: tetratricopeptide repeat protein [Woeseiaceae bacterium]